MEALRSHDPAAVGPYRIKGRLGTGGMGVVFLGVGRDGAPVAIKMIRPELAGDEEFRARFTREALAASRVDSPFTALVADADLDCPQPWMATEYVPGPSLQARVTLGGPLRARELADVGAGIASGLAAIHGAGLVHRDVKPSNIILSTGGPRIIDFGIAYVLEATTLTRTEMMVGSPGFLSPEQVRGAKVTPASDVFSLGATLVHAATGRTPFGSGPPEVLLYRVVHENADLEGVPTALGRLFHACLSKNPRSRPSAEEVHHELLAFMRRRTAAVPAVRAGGDGGTRRPAPGRAGTRPGTQRPGAHPGGRPAPPRTAGPRGRALLGRLVIFAVATGVAALIITFLPRVFGSPDPRSGPSPTATPTAPATATGDAGATSATVAKSSGAAAVPGGGGTTAASGVGPPGPTGSPLDAVPWGNSGLYRDFSAGGGPITLVGGTGTSGGQQVALTAQVPLTLNGQPAMAVILTRSAAVGGTAYDLVELFGLNGSAPVLLGGTASPYDPGAVSRWRLAGTVLQREQDYPSGPGGGSATTVVTNYAVGADGSVTDLGPSAP